jgi:hypothetical protein
LLISGRGLQAAGAVTKVARPAAVNQPRHSAI